MRFGMRVRPLVGLLAALVRLAATDYHGSPTGGTRRWGGPPGRAECGRASGILIGKAER